jgi:DNA polymerase (family X)
MPRSNDDVAAILQEYSDLMAISGGDAFRVRTYEKAARSVGGYHDDVSTLDLKGLQGIPNVGKSIAEKIAEYFRTGTIAKLEDLRSDIPEGVREMIAIPALGPKKAMLLHRDLGIGSIDELAHALRDHRLAGVKGFGPKTEENLLRGIDQLRSVGERTKVNVALDLAETLLGDLRELRQVGKAGYAGSLRRMAETIGDVDLLATSTKPGPVMDAFCSHPLVERVVAHGKTKSSISTTLGIQVDLRVIIPEVWGAALQYFTGSKAHNIRVREIAVRKGLKLSEYGLFRVKSGRLVVSETEEEVYERLGMPWIPPTLREDRGEIEAALSGELPDLIELKDIRGDLHTHTNLTDGLATLEQMIAAARERGYAYYAVTDHAELLYMQRMTKSKILAQRERLERLEARGKMVLLHGTELNIQPDGSVDWDEGFLDGFDVCVASVHSHFNQSSDDMTRRIIRAIEHPNVNIIGHPTTRKIGQRPPIDYDFDAVCKAAARTGTALEVDSYPDRLDLNDEHILRARRHGVRFSVDTDSHAVPHLDAMRFGVATAQRGWLTKADVITAWPLGRLRKFLDKGRKR